MNKDKETKIEALHLWRNNASKRSLLCSLTLKEYLDLIWQSLLEIQENQTVAAISIIKRSYILNNKRIKIQAMHRMVSSKSSGTNILKLIVKLKSNTSNSFSASSANPNATMIYKRMGFIETYPSYHLHTYIINPIYIPLVILAIIPLTLYSLRFYIPLIRHYRKNSSIEKAKLELKNYQELRTNNLTTDTGIRIDWSCKTLTKYLAYMIKKSKVIFFYPTISSRTKNSILGILRFNYIWRTIVLVDSTYNKENESKILNSLNTNFLITCLHKSAFRLFIPSLSKLPPLKDGHFIHLRSQKCTNLSINISNSRKAYETMSEQDQRSMLHGDSFL